MKKILCIISMSLLAFAGCSDDDDGVQAVENCTSNVEFCGMVARSSCEGSSLIDLSERNSLEFNGNTFKRVQRYYSSSDCSTTEAAVVEYSGEFTVDENEDSARAGDMNISLTKGTIKVNDESAADILSVANFCGVENYEAGKSYEITGEQTEGTCPIMNMPVDLYGSYEIDDNKLILDHHINEMATSEEDRSTDLEVEYTID